MKKLKFNKEQLNSISQYFSDVSKLLLGSAVIGFFIPNSGAIVTPLMFAGGFTLAAASLYFSINLLK